MALQDLLDRNLIQVPLESGDKEGVLSELVAVLKNKGIINDSDSLLNALVERESLGSTGLDKGIAVPHAKTEQIQDLCIILGISPGGVDFEALDGQDSHLFFMIISRPEQSSQHIQALSQIAGIARNEDLCRQLKAAENPDAVMDLIREA